MDQALYPWPSEEAPDDGKAAQQKKRRRGRELRIRINADHTIDVLHASDIVPVEACAVELSDSAGGPVWIQLARTGSYQGHPMGPFRLDEKIFQEIVENFLSTENRRIPIDFEHASEQHASEGAIPTAGAPAQGWITELKVEGGNLFGLVEWLEPARSYIRTGQYRYISPAIRFNSKDRVTGRPVGARLTSAGLTNSPFLDGLLPLAAKDADLEAMGRALTDALSARSSSGPTTNDAGAGAPAEQKEAVMSGAEPKLLSDLQTANAELTLTLKARDARITELEKRNNELESKEKEREEADLIKEVDDAVATYKDKKGLSDDDKPTLMTFARASREAFRKMYPPVPPAQRHLLREIATPRSNEPPPPNGDAAKPVDFYALVDQFQKDGKTFEEAIAMAAEKAFSGVPSQQPTTRRFAR